MKKVKAALLVIMVSAILFGCAGLGIGSGSFSPEASSIYAAKDGTVSSALVESYSKENYDEESLKTFLQNKAAAYNTANQAGADKPLVTLQSCSVSKGIMTAVFDYASVQDLLQFSKESKDSTVTLTNLEVATVADGTAQGKIQEVSFVSAKDGSSVTGEAVSQQGKLYLVTVEGAARIQTEGKLLYMTEGVTKVDDKTAATAEGTSYLVFK